MVEHDVDNFREMQSATFSTFIQQICQSFVNDRQNFEEGMFRVPPDDNQWVAMKGKMESNDEFKKLSGKTQDQAGLFKRAIRDHARSQGKSCLIPLTGEQITQLPKKTPAEVLKVVNTLSSQSIAKDYFSCFTRLAVNIAKETEKTQLTPFTLAVAVGPSTICAEVFSDDRLAQIGDLQSINRKFFEGAIAEIGDDDERVQEPAKPKTKQSGGGKVKSLPDDEQRNGGDDSEGVQEEQSEPKPKTKASGGGKVKSLVEKYENMAD